MNILQCRTCSLGYSEEFPVDTNDVYSDRDYLPIAIAVNIDIDYEHELVEADKTMRGK